MNRPFRYAIDLAPEQDRADVVFGDRFVPPAVSDLTDVTPDPRATAVDAVEVVFSEVIDPTTLDASDLALTRDGAAVPLGAAALTFAQVGTGPTYRVGGLGAVTAAAGRYELTVNGAGIASAAGVAAVGSASDAWVNDQTPPAAPTGLSVTPDTGASAADGLTRAATVTFSGRLGEGGLRVRVYDATTGADLGPADVAGTGFSRVLTLAPGPHQLRVRAEDAAGNVSADADFGVFVDQTGPAVVGDLAGPAGVQTAPVDAAEVTFDGPIDPATLDAADFALTRDGVAVPVGGPLAFGRVAGNRYRVSGLAAATSAPGAYTLTFAAAGVQDPAGNPGTGTAAAAWTAAAVAQPQPPTPPTSPGQPAAPVAGVSPVLAGGGSGAGSAAVYTRDAATGRFAAAPATAPNPFGDTGTDVRVAAGDVNGDRIPDLIFATGPGTPFRVAVVSGADNTTLLVAPFNPFPSNPGEAEFAAGGFVSAGDFDRDGRAEFVVSPDRSGGPRVSIYALDPAAGLVRRANFFTVDPGFRGGARTAVGDVNRDGTPDLAVAAGYGGGPRVVLFDGRRAFTTTGFDEADKLVPDFFAFPDAVRNGVYLAAGDVDGDGFADLVFGAAAGGAPAVKVVSGRALLGPGGNVAAVDGPLSGFTFDDPSTGGVRVAAVDADGDARADVVVSSGEGRPARVRLYRGIDFAGTTGAPAAFLDLDPLGGATLADGVFVG